MYAQQYIPFITKSTRSQAIHQYIYYIHHKHETNGSTSALVTKVSQTK